MQYKIDSMNSVKSYATKAWFQWLVAVLIFFCFSWLYMGRGITSCSVSSVAGLGSDSTGGMAWNQWVGGNDFTWGTTNKSNYPFGEKLDKPQFITSTVFLGAYKLFATLTTPICGLNLIILLGYMSSALMMFGLVRWLLKRFDIAVFAGYAAAFVPFHVLKAQSHINYIYGSIFIALIWVFLWMISKPSYKRSALFAAVSAVGFYFDGYFILLSSLLIVGLVGSQVVVELYHLLGARGKRQKALKQSAGRLKYTLVAGLMLGLLLLPIAAVFKSSGSDISQSLAAVRSNIKVETLLYGARPIEFVLPAASNPLMSSSYGAYRMSKLHGSNYSEATLYVGFTVLLLAVVGVVNVFSKKKRTAKLQNIPYPALLFMLGATLLLCFAFSLPAYAWLFGHSVRMPSLLLVKVTANWRVLSRIFLVMDPLLILLASLGLYWLTKKRSRLVGAVIVVVCGLALFLEYLPSPISSTGDLYKETPPIYKQLTTDDSVRIVAEYPLADFSYTPTIFTFQPVHKKTLVNANDGSVSRGPFDSSIAGLADPQTLGVLKSLKVDEVITHGFQFETPELQLIFKNQNYSSDGKLNLPASSYAYKFTDLATAVPAALVITKGYESLYVDAHQISHRYITNRATMHLHHFTGAPKANSYVASFSALSACSNPARVTVEQEGRVLWTGLVDKQPVPIAATVADKDFTVKTELCSIEVSHLSATPQN